MSGSSHQLDLPKPGGKRRHSVHLEKRRPKRPSRGRQLGEGALLGIVGSGLLVGLLQIPERLDTLLLVSNAVANLISGLSNLATGLLQLAAVLLVVLVALFALLLLVGAVVRILRAVLPREGGVRP